MVLLLLWLPIIFTVQVSGNLIGEYEEMTHKVLFPRDDPLVDLPVDIGVDRASGCICRASQSKKVIVCFGNYLCKRFPEIKFISEVLRVRTSVIVKIMKGQLDQYYSLNVLDIEANHQLKHIEPGSFKNLTNLKHLSISYNTALHALDETVFEGLVSLRNLTLVNNGFNNILQITSALKASILPSLYVLSLSENSFEVIPKNSFTIMKGTTLRKLDLSLCRLDFIDPDSFLPLQMLKELNIGENDMNSSLIENFLSKMLKGNIKLIHLDLNGMGFRKKTPKTLMEIIANSSIKRLILANNQFEIIDNDSFPRMTNLEMLDLRKVSAIDVDPHAFNPNKFPNLKILLLGGNHLPGLHQRHLSDQLLLLDLSNNKGNDDNPLYYEIDKDTFVRSKELLVLNLAFNNIKALLDYTFRGLDKLKILSLENGTIFHIGPGTFKATKSLEMLNLANNPLTFTENLTSLQFEGLHDLKILILKNCGIRRFNDDDNIFEMMTNLTHLILSNNQLYYITAETLKPIKALQVLDLSQNLFISWWRPLFISSGVKPNKILLANNKISHISISMIQDISFLLESKNVSEINLSENVFVCDCHSMYLTFLWLEVNGSIALKEWFSSSSFKCSSPDLWEDRRVADYLRSIKSIHCLMYEKISNFMVIVWTAPSLITIILLVSIIAALYKYRKYILYWIFLAKFALGRKFVRKDMKANNIANLYKYDAFISYCFEDRDFVLEMINQLETNPPYLKLCVSERDFEVGAFISEAILNSVNESKFIILLISNNFAKSHWCRWETQLAEYHRLFLEDGTTHDPLVLARIGDIENKLLTPTLKYLLKTKIYLSWDDNNPDEFWKKLRNLLSKSV